MWSTRTSFCGLEGPVANILQFKQAPEEGRRKGATRDGQSAEIVIFPGVRYERWDGRSGLTEQTGVKPVRDILKIVD